MNAREPAALTQRLGFRHPLVQGPFGGGLSTVKLAATVSNLGGLGSFGAHDLAPADIEKVTRELAAATKAPFAVNLWVSDHDPGGLALDAAEFARVRALFAPYYRELGLELPEPPASFTVRFDDQVDALLDAKPPVFSFVFGIPCAAVLEACRRRGIATVGTATTLAEARALDEAGVDVIVATGCEAGGHRPSFLASAEESLTGTFALTQLIAPRVKAPVIAAGGIVDGRGVRAAVTLGAAGAQVGTAFLACEESGAPPEHRAALFSPQAEKTALTRAFTGRLARGIRNRWIDDMAPHLAELPPFPAQSWFFSRLKQAAVRAHRTDFVSLWSGQCAPNLRHRAAPALMRALIEDLPD